MENPKPVLTCNTTLPTNIAPESAMETVSGDPNSPRFKGVVKRKSGKYRARISLNHKTVWLGTFDTAEEAALAHDTATRKHRGIKAVTNFPLNRIPGRSTTTVDSSELNHDMETPNPVLARYTTIPPNMAPNAAERVSGDVKSACFKGVVKRKSGKYTAKISLNNKCVWLGTFVTSEEAAHAYDTATRKHRGSRAFTNFQLNRSPGCSSTTIDSSELNRDVKTVCKKRASGSAPAVKSYTDNEDGDFATEKEIGKKGTSKRDEKRARVAPLNIPGALVVRNEDPPIKSSNNSNSSNLDGSQPSEFVSNFENFKILIHGTTIQLEQHVQKAYFKLCRSQNSYLHHHFIKSVDSALASSVISGTVTIANKIRQSNMFTPQDDIKDWNKALDGFELFGMNIGFIRAGLNRLSGLTLALERLKEAKIERTHVQEKLKMEKSRLDKEIESLEKTVIKREVMYEEEANALW